MDCIRLDYFGRERDAQPRFGVQVLLCGRDWLQPGLSSFGNSLLPAQQIRQNHSTPKNFPRTVQGACKNCGAMGHKASECVERPRSGKKAAMKTGMDIAADDVHTDLTSHGKVRYAGPPSRGFHYLTLSVKWREGVKYDLERRGSYPYQ